MRKFVIWYLKRKLKQIKHEMEIVEINQGVIHNAQEVYDTIKKKKKALADTIAMLKNHEY